MKKIFLFLDFSFFVSDVIIKVGCPWAQLLNQGFPAWDTCTPGDTFAYPKGYI